MRRRPRVRRLLRRGDVARLGGVLEYSDRTLDRDGRLVDLGVGERLAAIDALASIGGGDAADALETAVGDPVPVVRRAAVRALANWQEDSGRPSAARVLATAVATSHAADEQETRVAALGLAEKAGEPGLASTFVEALLAVPELPELDTSLLQNLLSSDPDPGEERRVIQRLIDALDEDQSALRERAAALLGVLGPHAVDGLLEALERVRDRRRVAIALGQSHDRRATSPLAELLNDGDAELRRIAVAGLAALADPRAIKPLLHAADDDDYSVRASALEALNHLGSAAVAIAASLRANSSMSEAVRELPTEPLLEELNAPSIESTLANGEETQRQHD